MNKQIVNEPAVPQGLVVEGEEYHLQDVADIPFEELVERALVDVADFPRHPGFLAKNFQLSEQFSKF